MTQLRPPVEGVFSVKLDKELVFTAASNYIQNVRYAVVIKFGHLADQFKTLDSKYNPLLEMRANYWYTDQ